MDKIKVLLLLLILIIVILIILLLIIKILIIMIDDFYFNVLCELIKCFVLFVLEFLYDFLLFIW